MKIKCKCGKTLAGIDADWTLTDRKVSGHQVATIGNADDAPDDIRAAAQFQIAANLAAYDLDYDHIFDLIDKRRSEWSQVRGRAFVQCPQARDKITTVCFPR